MFILFIVVVIELANYVVLLCHTLYLFYCSQPCKPKHAKGQFHHHIKWQNERANVRLKPFQNGINHKRKKKAKPTHPK